MNKIVLALIGLVVLTFLVAEPKIDLKLFAINFKSPYSAAGIFFLILSLIFLRTQSYSDGYDKGKDSVIEALKNGKHL